MANYQGQNAGGSARQHNGNVHGNVYHIHSLSSWEHYRRLEEDPWRHDQQQLRQLGAAGSLEANRRPREPQAEPRHEASRQLGEERSSWWTDPDMKPCGQDRKPITAAENERSSSGPGSVASSERFERPEELQDGPSREETYKPSRRETKPDLQPAKPDIKAFCYEQDFMDSKLLEEAEKCATDNVKYWIRNGANVRYADYNGCTALFVAMRRNYKVTQKDNNADRIETANELLRAGADVNARVRTSYSCLHAACDGGYMAVVDALIAAGADVNACNDAWETPLHSVVSNKNGGDISLALIRAGADVNAINKDGETLLDILERCARLWAPYGSPEIWTTESLALKAILLRHGGRTVKFSRA